LSFRFVFKWKFNSGNLRSFEKRF